MRARIGFALILLAEAAGAASVPTPTEILVEMNALVFRSAVAEDGLLTLKGVRTASMLHAAAHDALNSQQREYAGYAFTDEGIAADSTAAMVSAGCEVASTAYAQAFEQPCRTWLAALADGQATREGLAAGRAAAKAVMKARRSDGWDTQAEYHWHPMAPGVYAEFSDHSQTPQGFVFGAGWARARGFALQTPDQFRVPPPPAIDSAQYTRDFNEVKSVGRFQTLSRTQDQTHLALWWKDFVENSHNRLARTLVLAHELEVRQTARLFALLNMSVFDAYVSSFDNKFFYNHWRPYTAIRWAAEDGNPDTDPEETWNNTHLHTYAFPSYPSAHGTACAAAMTVMADTFGDTTSFTMHNPVVDLSGPGSEKLQMKPAERAFKSFSEAARECSLSRVYLGIHFRYDSTAGTALGKQIGQNVLANLMVREPAR